MRHLTVFLICVVFLGGCSNVDVYTFKKERVDQKDMGNRGYIEGTPPPRTDTGSSKRTLIGIDVDMGTSGADHQPEGEEASGVKGEVIKTRSSGGTVTTVVEEEDYIK
ncbi:MAG: hypothetical protein GF408_08195 [Candidatus Omnitrophica bacterium]|nr:hypothetical protein [Candidatus Omnitrophota bacterium]